ncbi:MAG: hypothetical protein FD169_862 [Bacillota bacterium]|nr:MAG: hypothetical protein FD169_862 [Bacillota bacterium]
MKKVIALVSIFALAVVGLLGMGQNSAQASTIQLMFNGRYLTLDVAPVIQSGRTLVPFRVLFEALGASVQWNDATSTVTGVKGSTTVSLVIGSTNATVNGKAIKLDVAPTIIKGRTLVPVRFVSENLGADVTWVPSKQTVVVRGPAPATTFKVGIMTGTAVQNEEELRAAENAKKKYGDRIVLTTYPAKFATETETTISNLKAIASDKSVKAIIINQAVVGSASAIDAVKKMRPDMLIIAGTPGEDRDLMAGKADILMQLNDIERGVNIIEQAHKMGAKTFVHYSFARHMSNATLYDRRVLMEKTCEKLGIKFVFADAPDPTGEGGTPGTQQFIMEDVPRKIAQYGKDTAFFGTNCSMMEPMIKQVIAGKAIFPVQCCPSPYHAYPGALGISIPTDKQGNVPYVIEQIKIALTKVGMEKRVSTWPVPVNMLYIEAGVDYAMAYLNNQTNGMVDMVSLEGILMAKAGGPVYLSNLKSSKTGVLYPHYFLFLSDYVDFSK